MNEDKYETFLHKDMDIADSNLIEDLDQELVLTLFQRDIADITFFMGIFIILATLILISGWKYQGPINNYTSGSFGTGIGFFAGFFGVPTGPLTGLFFLSLKEDIKIIMMSGLIM